MFKFIVFFIYFVSTCNADFVTNSKVATLKPLSACCDIPELGDPKPLSECSNPKPPGPCDDVQCVFEKSGFLKDKSTLNKEAYRKHLQQWAGRHEGWTPAVEKALEECVDKNLRQYLNVTCKAYDVFTCTGIAMLKKCPDHAWKC
ncbi:uncharacterized protein LOC106135977 [Amyelois transitella]|uniref:uncharacterized protein LOC106135977 n=1 Tax=Amyelois transitella TaxID=680683 RepID=UPI0029903604|nr:uncharacterized protein LOC106135977 [Amyelois transitella]